MNLKISRIVTVACAWMAMLGGLDFQACLGRAEPGQPVITSIRYGEAQVDVVVQVPTGIRKVTLESRTHLSIGAWEPRAVARLEGAGGNITFRLTTSAAFELLRVRGDSQEALPAFFYRGTNVFAGQPINNLSSAAVNPSDFTLFESYSAAANLSIAPGNLLVDTRQDSNVARTVVESDIWKIAGDTLYFFNQYRGLQVIDLHQPDAPEVRSTLRLPGVGEQMYVLPQGPIVLLARTGADDMGNLGNEILVIETSGDSLRILARLPINGKVRESRMVGTALYVAAEAYRPVTNASQVVWQWQTAVASFDLAQPSAPVARDTWSFAGYGNAILATDRYLFIADQEGNAFESLALRCLDIAQPDGSMKLLSTLRTVGRIKDKFKMHLNGDVFTAISERSVIRPGTGGGSSQPVTELETFSLADPTAPVKLGALPFGQGETLYASRFDGDRVYIVTFRQTDPLWIVNLADPAHPQIQGELQVPGWSTFIQPLGDRLVSIGVDNTSNWRVAVSLFDVADPAKPTLLSRIPLGENSSWSEANSDEKALGVLPEAGLILVPFTSYSTMSQSGIQVIDLSRNALAKRGVISHPVEARRATVHRDRILSLSGPELLSVDATDRDQPVLRSRLELAFPVHRALLAGDFLIELANPLGNGLALDWRGATVNVSTNNPPILRIARAADPDQVLTRYSLTNQAILGASVKDNRLYLAQGISSQVNWQFNEAQKLWIESTNPASFTLTILDLGALPEVTQLGQTNLISDTLHYWGEMEALWPKPGVVAWAGQGQQQAYGTVDFMPLPSMVRTFNPGGDLLMPTLAVMPLGGSASSLTLAGNVWGGPWWPFQTSARRLLAFEVSDTFHPQFHSEVTLPTGTGGNSSVTLAAEGLIFASHQAVESQIIGTNLIVVTNIDRLVLTNLVLVTNVTSIPEVTWVTNNLTITNAIAEPVLTTAANVETITGYTERVDSKWLPTVGQPVQAVIAAGHYHNLARYTDGSPWSWGGNWFGELGDGTRVGRAQRQTISILNDVTCLAAGGFHSLALQTDGSLWTWGANSFNQLGATPPPEIPGQPPLPTVDQASPVKLEGMTGCIALAAGVGHSLALKADGSVWSCGDNWYGQLGLGSVYNVDRLTPISDLTGVIAVAAGHDHSLAITASGQLWTWGKNESGQLGDGTGIQRNTPILVVGLDKLKAVAGGRNHTVALRQDGTVWAWGQNDQGQLGDGPDTPRLQPAPVPGLSQVVAVAAGEAHSLALKADGSVWAWGANEHGQLGDGTLADQNHPVPVLELNEVRQVAAGNSHSLALRTDGQLCAWGDNQFGQLGEGQTLRRAYVRFQTNIITTTNFAWITNLITMTNVAAVTTYTLVTNQHQVEEYTCLTNLTVATNAEPVVRMELKHFLDVVDYTGPEEAAARPPVNLPGELQGLAYNGALIYTSGQRWTTNGIPDATLWLDACAYDGVTASLVDSLAWSNGWPATTFIVGNDLVIGVGDSTTNRQTRLESWTLNSEGRFVPLGTAALAGPVSASARFGELLVFEDQDRRYQLFDATHPAQLRRLGEGKLGFGVWGNLKGADGALTRGVWLPTGDFGVEWIPVAP